MQGIIYILCAATCLLCAIMLFRGYYRSGVRLLFWSALCFVGLIFDNILLYVDLHVLGTEISLAVVRKVPGLLGLMLLLYGLVWESK